MPSGFTSCTERSVPFATWTVTGVTGLSFSLACGLALTWTGSATGLDDWLGEAGDRPADVLEPGTSPDDVDVAVPGGVLDVDVQADSNKASPRIGMPARRSAELRASCENNCYRQSLALERARVVQSLGTLILPHATPRAGEAQVTKAIQLSDAREPSVVACIAILA